MKLYLLKQLLYILYRFVGLVDQVPDTLLLSSSPLKRTGPVQVRQHAVLLVKIEPWEQNCDIRQHGRGGIVGGLS